MFLLTEIFSKEDTDPIEALSMEFDEDEIIAMSQSKIDQLLKKLGPCGVVYVFKDREDYNKAGEESALEENCVFSELFFGSEQLDNVTEQLSYDYAPITDKQTVKL